MNRQSVRLLLVGVTVCWVITSMAYLGMNGDRRWYPGVVGVFAAFAAVATAVMAVRPRTIWAFRFGGTIAIGALMLRTISVLMGLFIKVDIDAIWISLSSVAATVMICIFYWKWWLTEVKSWHEAHKRTDRRRSDPR